MITKDRLEQSVSVLELIDRHREEARDLTVASGVERFLLELEFRELEADILADPGCHRTLGAHCSDRDRRRLRAVLLAPPHEWVICTGQRRQP